MTDTLPKRHYRTPSPSRGGKREGAGRKPSGEKRLRGILSIPIEEETAALYKSLPAPVRRTILAKLRAAAQAALAEALIV